MKSVADHRDTTDTPPMRPPTGARPIVLRYGFAVLVSAPCFALAMILNYLADRSMFQLALVAVVLSSWYGGLGPGLLATLLETTATAYFILTPQYSMSIAREGDLLQVTVFILVSLLMSTLSEARLRAEAALRKRTVQLEEANQQLATFSYSVSHDLRTPLRVIDNHAREALDSSLSDPKEQSLRWILVRKQVQELGNLLEGLLALGRISRQALRKETVDVGLAVHTVWAALEQEQAGRAVTLSLGDLPPCEADPALLNVVLKNLLENALKFTRTKPEARVEVGCYASGEPIYFVKDNGIGFDMQFTRHLFGVFQRLHQDKTIEGNGLGLAIAQQIVQRHGGKIWAEAAKDLGATFYFTFPKGLSS